METIDQTKTSAQHQIKTHDNPKSFPLLYRAKHTTLFNGNFGRVLSPFVISLFSNYVDRFVLNIHCLNPIANQMMHFVDVIVGRIFCRQQRILGILHGMATVDH